MHDQKLAKRHLICTFYAVRVSLDWLSSRKGSIDTVRQSRWCVLLPDVDLHKIKIFMFKPLVQQYWWLLLKLIKCWKLFSFWGLCPLIPNWGAAALGPCSGPWWPQIGCLLIFGYGHLWIWHGSVHHGLLSHANLGLGCRLPSCQFCSGSAMLNVSSLLSLSVGWFVYFLCRYRNSHSLCRWFVVICSDYVKVRNALCLYGKYGDYHCAFRVKQVCNSYVNKGNIFVLLLYWAFHAESTTGEAMSRQVKEFLVHSSIGYTMSHFNGPFPCEHGSASYSHTCSKRTSLRIVGTGFLHAGCSSLCHVIDGVKSLKRTDSIGQGKSCTGFVVDAVTSEVGHIIFCVPVFWHLCPCSYLLSHVSDVE